MNIDQEQLASDHQSLDDRIDQMVVDPTVDSAELSELKKVRLRVKDMLEGIIPIPVLAT